MTRFALGFESLRSLCERRGLPFKTHEDTGQIALLHRVLDEDAPMYLVPHAGRALVSVVLPVPFRVPADRRAAVAEAVNRLNVAACAGCWALDLGAEVEAAHGRAAGTQERAGVQQIRRHGRVVPVRREHQDERRRRHRASYPAVRPRRPTRTAIYPFRTSTRTERGLSSGGFSTR
jgi:hypothetical protein